MKQFKEIKFKKDTILIYYPFRWGRQFQDKSFWCAELNGQADDYHTK